MNDLGAVDPTQIRGGDRKIGVTELALNHNDRHAFMGHLNSVRVP
jgi:hypothetical protein